MSIDRRHFLYLLGATLGTATLSTFSHPVLAQETPETSKPFTLLPLPYAYNALEPYIDEETMKFHHDKHYATYTQKLNVAVNKYPNLKNQTAEQLLEKIETLPKDIRTTVRDNGGGYVNHTMFWEIMAPNSGGMPKGEIAQAIKQTFGSFEAFQTAFNEEGSKVFGSGWAWLVLDKTGKLKVISTSNQDSPLMQSLKPIMGNDVWEHAYYLKYRNKREDYLKQWWNVVNWDEVNRRFLAAKK